MPLLSETVHSGTSADNRPCDTAEQGGRARSTQYRSGLQTMQFAQVDSRIRAGFRPTCDCTPAEPVPCTILDPFNGSGTTGLVAIQEGRHYIGIDASEEYTREIAIPRLETVCTGLTAADIARGQLSLLGDTP